MNDVANATGNFGDQVVIYAQEWGPRILAALAILLIGWLIASAAKWAVASVINKTPLARANKENAKPRDTSTVGAKVGSAVFWIILLIAIFMAAQPLQLTSATGPLGAMLNDFGQAIPRIIGAALILFLGYIVASVAKNAVEAVITAGHVEKLTTKVGAQPPADPNAIPKLVGGIVFALIIIPVAIAALDTLNIDAISEPATAMLQLILNAIPRVIAAGIILAIAYAIGKFASNLLAQFLATSGFDRTINSLGLFLRTSAAQATKVDPPTGREAMEVSPSGGAPITPSKAVGTVVFVAIVVFGLMEAFRQLDFAYGSRILAEILGLFGQVVFGAVIIAAAVVIARVIAKTIEASGGQGARMVATFTKVAIIVLGAAIGLRFMGLANDIVNLAFGLLLGAIAVAAAISFGLGGREPARQLLQKLFGKVEEKVDAPSASAAAKPAPPPPAR